MVRKKLIWHPGALYHVTSRGNHRNDIFRDEEDYKWSSYSMMVSLEKEKLITSGNLLNYFNEENCRELYREVIVEGLVFVIRNLGYLLLNSKYLEFKQYLPDSGKISKTVIGFSNGAGGKLIIGVSDNGEVTGVSDDEIFDIPDKILMVKT